MAIADGPGQRLPLLVVATTNPGKRAEFARLLASLPWKVADLSLAGDGYVPPPEDGETYADNARTKALAAARASGRVALADDSGLEVEALDGAPGVHSARYGGEGLDDGGRVRRLLEALSGVPASRRGAAFVAHLTVASPDGRVLAEVEVAVGGRIAFAPRGHGGFGYDPVFEPLGMGCTMAELAPAAKDLFSHRGRATQLLLPALRRLALDVRAASA
ncbi:MAG: non-canonical purine NTP pyrophosphatase [Firmicutes bacterium]|nr:non-canonical purine NTP pyrophosphatase [Bacillota bacterium]